MADDWEPPPGMEKRQCVTCMKIFASAGQAECATCRTKGIGGSRGGPRRASASPYAPSGSSGGQVGRKDGAV